ncbi:pilin [Patescibacteria group bacterium]|nr:pilin [Patescibacteria group bacterium]
MNLRTKEQICHLDRSECEAERSLVPVISSNVARSFQKDFSATPASRSMAGSGRNDRCKDFSATLASKSIAVSGRNDRLSFITLGITFLFTFLLPKIASAQVQNTYKFPDPLNADVPTLVNRIVSATLATVGAVFFIMFLWGGWLWMTAGGGTEKVEKSIKTLRNAVIGLIIVATSYAIVTFVINTIAKGAGE